MLHVFSTNRVKLVTRIPTATIKRGQREYFLKEMCAWFYYNAWAYILLLMFKIIRYILTFLIQEGCR